MTTEMDRNGRIKKGQSSNQADTEVASNYDYDDTAKATDETTSLLADTDGRVASTGSSSDDVSTTTITTTPRKDSTWEGLVDFDHLPPWKRPSVRCPDWWSRREGEEAIFLAPSSPQNSAVNELDWQESGQ